MADSIDAVWALLQKHQQEVFHTAKGLPFTYTIRGRGAVCGSAAEVYHGLYRSKRTGKNFQPWRRRELRSAALKSLAAMGQAISIRYC